MTTLMRSHPFNIKNPVHLLAIGFGSGLLKPAPGTWGTLMAVPFYYALRELPLEYYCAAVLMAGLAGIYLCGKTASDIGVHDHSSIVWDEFVGLWLALMFCPHHWIWVLAGFCLFRLFDIVKPFPIGWLDKHIHGGFGIMADDILAALYAMGSLSLIISGYKLYLGIAD